MLYELGKRITGGGRISREEAIGLAELNISQIYELISVSNTVTRHFRGTRLELCSIINARSGNCSEDCSFCAQSSRYNTGAAVYPIASPREILRQALAMEKAGARRFSIVTSGRGISGRDLETVLNAVDLLKRETGLGLCASLGIIDEKKALMLKEAGVTMYHHNLEACSGYYPSVCTTHSHNDRVNTVRAAQKAGLRVCSGGILGLGESFLQRVELAFEIRELEVDSVPVNFLSPIAGTPLEGAEPLQPIALLHTLAIFRLILPGAALRLCGGRKQGLGRLQPLAFMAGADGVMIGDYLTTKGEDPDGDRKMFADLGLNLF